MTPVKTKKEVGSIGRRFFLRGQNAPAPVLIETSWCELIENEIVDSLDGDDYQQVTKNPHFRIISIMSNRDRAGGVEGITKSISRTDKGYENFSSKKGRMNITLEPRKKQVRE